MSDHNSKTTIIPTEPLEGDWTLGLDIGSNSVGWMLLRDQPVPGSVNVYGGVRVFPSGTANEKNVESSKCEGRRTARGMRRQHHRRSGRKQRLHSLLRRFGLLPAEPTATAEILALDPYPLRARGLDEALTPHEFARVLIHLAQRRGFKSNRRTDTKDTGTVKEGIAELRTRIDEAGCRTLGEFLARLDPRDERRRDRYTSRAMIRDEFDLLWNAQRHHHPDLLTDEVHDALADAVFFQRPFEQPERLAALVGQCEFEPSEKRCRVGHRLAQRFRILQEVANLAVMEPGQPERPLTAEERAVVAGALEHQKELALTRILKTLKLDPASTFNIARGERDKLKGNIAEVQLRKAFGKGWDSLDEERRNEICSAVLDLPDEELERAARNGWKLDDDGVAAIMTANLPDRHGRVSLKAIRNLLPHLEAGLTLTEARTACGYTFEQTTGEALPDLPAPPDDVTNPVVAKALFEVRRVVNAIIRKYGKPSRVVVELARDTRGSIEQRNDQNKQNARNRRRNEEIRDKLRSMGIAEPRRNDIIKYRLWMECGKECPFSGRSISFEDLFHSTRVQVEHIVPYPRSLDDSYGNKTLCFEDVNRAKGMRIPYEAFGHTPEWPDMVARVRRFRAADPSEFRMVNRKAARFLRHTFDDAGCVDRQLNDTRYISRQVRDFVRRLGVPVNCTSGRMTSDLRHCWGLNSLLSPDGSEDKYRGDHRHHAIDAAVIALTNPRHLQSLARREKYRLEREDFPPPWPGFRDEVARAIDAIHVSHRPTRRVRGPLHEETNYGPTAEQDVFVYRKPLASITFQMVADIRDRAVRRLVEERLAQHDLDPATQKGAIPNHVFAEPLCLPNRNGPPVPVRRVRLTTRLTGMVGFAPKNPAGVTPGAKPYRFAKTGSNHHITLWEWEEPARGSRPPRTVRGAVAVTLYDAARRIARHEPLVCRTHPTRPDARFLMSLCKNDMVLLRISDEPEELCRVQQISCVGSTLDIVFRLHIASGLEDASTKRRITSLAPDKVSLRKVTVSPIGEIQPCND